MKKLILSAVLLAAGLVAAFAQEQTEEAVKPSFWNGTFVEAGDGGALSLSAGIGNAFVLNAGKWFNKSVGVGINYNNIHIFDGNRSFSDNLIGVAFLWNFLGKVERESVWTPVLSPELGWLFTNNQGANSSLYAGGSFNNYFRVYPNVDLMLNSKLYFGIDPQNTGRIPFITTPTLLLSIGARYSF